MKNQIEPDMKLDNTEEEKQLELAQVFAKGSFALKLKEKIKRLRDDSGGSQDQRWSPS